MKINEGPNFRRVYSTCLLDFAEAKRVNSGTWQGIDISNKPEADTYEIEDYIISFPMAAEDLKYYRFQIGPNLPWADDHFEKDRVSGQPLNPGHTWKQWPWANKSTEFQDDNDQFSHSYAERYWPKLAGQSDQGELRGLDLGRLAPLRGIRYDYGDLFDLVRLLARNPKTRNAYLPVWFPEDTGVLLGQRTPCSIGYLVRMRNDRLSMFYQIRSCDFYRHFKDDVYLTIRLLLWVLDRCRELDASWKHVRPGTFTMHIGSFHLFVNDRALVLK